MGFAAIIYTQKTTLYQTRQKHFLWRPLTKRNTNVGDGSQSSFCKCLGNLKKINFIVAHVPSPKKDDIYMVIFKRNLDGLEFRNLEYKNFRKKWLTSYREKD